MKNLVNFIILITFMDKATLGLCRSFEVSVGSSVLVVGTPCFMFLGYVLDTFLGDIRPSSIGRTLYLHGELDFTILLIKIKIFSSSQNLVFFILSFIL